MNRDMALKMKPGMKVITDFSGKLTEHTIVTVEIGTRSQTGVIFTVTPAVPKSSGVRIDAGWFQIPKVAPEGAGENWK